MPVFIAALIGALVQAAGTLVGRVLISLGIGYVAYSGLDVSITWVRDQAIASLSGLAGQTVQAAGVLRIGTCISILTSAMLARITLNGLTGGVLKKMVVK